MVYDLTIIGAGLIGLATGRELLRRHPSLRLLVLDKEQRVAAHQSGHNSGVIHSGIYYMPGSLKATLCIDGRRALFEYCDKRHIAYNHTGKLIVAVDQSEIAALQLLYERGVANGLEGLHLLDPAGIAEREPYCRGIAAIHVPQTAIVDYEIVASALLDDIRNSGGELRTGAFVQEINVRDDRTDLHTGIETIRSWYVIACAGLHADRIATMAGGNSEPKIIPFRGDYLVLKPEKRGLIRGNIYPVPDPAFPFLGPHFTPRMNGDVWLGPNAVLAFAREGYSLGTIDKSELFETLTYPGFIRLTAKFASVGFGELYRDMVRGAFVRNLQRYVPDLNVRDTLPGPAGVRAQAMRRDGSLVDDFVFEHTGTMLHVRNAPSPGATASLAIAGHIANEADRQFGLS